MNRRVERRLWKGTSSPLGWEAYAETALLNGKQDDKLAVDAGAAYVYY